MYSQLDYRQVEDATKLKFNAAIVDCEACVGNVLVDEKGGGSTHLLDQLDLIILELDGARDGQNSRLYQTWSYEVLPSHGFHRIWVSQDTMDPSSSWSVQLFYHAWQRIKPLPEHASYLPRYNRSICSQTRQRMNYSMAELRCNVRGGY